MVCGSGCVLGVDSRCLPSSPVELTSMLALWLMVNAIWAWGAVCIMAFASFATQPRDCCDHCANWCIAYTHMHTYNIRCKLSLSHMHIPPPPLAQALPCPSTGARLTVVFLTAPLGFLLWALPCLSTGPRLTVVFLTFSMLA